MGAFLDRPNTAKTNASGALAGVRYAVAAMQGYRAAMEDRHVALERLGDGPLAGWALFAVLDGHAGVSAAHSTAARLPRALRALDALRATGAQSQPLPQSSTSVSGRHSGERERDDENERLVKAIVSTFREADESLRVELESAADRSGCTVCALLISCDRLVFANCGDSRAVLVRDRKAAFGTEDHKPANDRERERTRLRQVSVSPVFTPEPSRLTAPLQASRRRTGEWCSTA